MTTDYCPFCRIVQGHYNGVRVLYRDDNVAAFFPIDPATTGHTLVAPTRHVSHVWDLEQREVADLAEAVHRVARTLHAALQPEGLNIIQSNGDAATQTVPHVHVHLVPRSADDRMILQWPDGASDDPATQDQVLDRLRLHLLGGSITVSPEDRRQHLSFIQAVITRMSQASTTVKAWLLPIITATFGYAIVKNSWSVAWLGALAVVVFGLLDANYLKQERLFRKLYDDVAQGNPIPPFSMNPALAASEGKKPNYWPDSKDLASWAVLLFYGPLLVVAGVIALYLMHAQHHWPFH